ncbi:MAG TPA: NADH dehydrogenase [Archaeoglobus profundus]|nr:NADH dehydrogenase [Archaeoglobus profundus]
MVYALLIPLIVTFIAPLFGRKSVVLSFLAYITSFLIILYALLANQKLELHLIDITKPIGEFYLFADSISNAFGATICLVSAIVALYSLPYMTHRFKELNKGDSEFKNYIFLYNLYATSMLWLVYCGNLILLYIFLELSLLTSFLLIYMYGYGNRQWVALLYFVWTHIAGALALVGFLIIAFENSTAAFKGISEISFLAWLLIFLGMIVKLPGLGLHIWLPWAHAEAPTPVSALLSPLTVGLAGYILIRLYLISPWFINEFRDLILAYGIITSLYAGFAVFRQTDYKKLLAYSTISQMGYMLIGICLGTFGLIGAIIQYISHAFGKSILFMAAGSIITLYHLRDIEKMGGLHEYIPTISNAALIGFMNLSGILTIGLFSEIFILKGLVDLYGFNIYLIIAIIFMFIISGWYSFYTQKRIFYGSPRIMRKANVSRLLDVPPYFICIISIALLFPPLVTLLLKNLKLCIGGVVP